MKLTHSIEKEAPLSSISSKLFLTVCSYCLFLLVCFSVSLYYFQKSNYVEAHKNSYATILNLLSENLKAALSFNDILAADKILEASLEHHQIESMTIIKNDNIWAQVGSKDFSPRYLTVQGSVFDGSKFIARKEITMHRQSLGQVILIANASTWTQLEQNLIFIISTIGIATLLLLKLVHHRLYSLLSIRLKNITQLLGQIIPSSQQAPELIKKQDNDEIGHLAEVINSVLEAYSIQRSELTETLNTLSNELKNSKNLERSFRQKYLHEESSSNAKSQFIANLSQELKQSTTDIKGHIDLISEHIAKNPQFSSKTRDTVAIAQSSAHCLLTLICDILALSQSESGALKLTLNECYLVDVINQTINIVKPIIAKNNNKVTLHGELDSIKLYTDAIKLRQALTNIIANSAQFTDNGQITVSAYQFDDNKAAWVKILIKDTGLGIEHQQLSGLFGAYLQTAHTIDNQRKGGFGLALSKRLIEIMGGIISVASEPNQGTIFELDLPIRVEQPADDISSVQSPQYKEENPKKPSNNLLLFVSNHQPTINTIMLNWVDKQVQIQQSESISIARKQLDRFKFNALVIDSDFDAACWNFVAEMKSDIRTFDIPIIVIGKKSEIEKAMILGADEVLVKPVNVNKLHTIIRNYIELANV